MVSMKRTVALVAAAFATVPVARGQFLERVDRQAVASRQVDEARVQVFKEALAPTFAALPKNGAGQLDHQTVRYILHRAFVQRSGWYIKGLEPGGDTWGNHGEEGDWVPEFLIGEWTTRLEGGGIDLHDLSVLAAHLEDFARSEVEQRVSAVAAFLNVTTQVGQGVSVQLNTTTAQQMIDHYMVLFLGDHKWSLGPDVVSKFDENHAYWKPTETWFRGVERPLLTKADGNPETAVDFQKVVQIAATIGAQYGHYNDKECVNLKHHLLKRWSKGNSTGRVRLADFYAMGQEAEWNLNEKPAYLRSIGALDESNMDNPLVIVPNYLQARPNCLQSTDLYAICCRNECETLMGQLEQSVAAPTAPAEKILEVARTLRSGTTGAPVEITEEMRQRLDDMAILHGGDGKVHLHGRLFAQWMHHAFPTECPFPHMSGSSDPVTPDEWLSEDVSASEEEIQQHIDTAKDLLTGDGAAVVMPWEAREELLGAKHINVTDAASSLAFELSGERKERLKEFRNMLQPYYAAWPKDADGNLEHQTARYVLHRLFVQRHSWFIKGLEPNGDNFHAETHEESYKDWVPNYMMELMEERVGRRGLDLNDLAALGAALEDRVNKEADGTLGDAWKALSLEDKVNRTQVHEALSIYMIVYLGSGVWNLDGAMSGEFQKNHQYWNATEAWFRGVEEKQLNAAEGPTTFATTAQIAKDIGAQYGEYNGAECQRLKEALMKTWGQGKATGRVRLADFYRLGLATEWSLSEKSSYLRTLGALDETNEGTPMVMIPNYLSAKPNCLQATSLYAICCRNECEDLMAEIEKSVAAPTATPKRLVGLVQALKSPTVEAPRTLPQNLLSRLEDIAALHGGEVNLHGRLFAQWMHHAYPSECPYPHEAGTSDPISPEGWMGEDMEASEEERKQHVDSDTCGPEQAAAQMIVEMPWSDKEELLSSAASLKMQSAKAAASGSWVTWACLAVLVLAAIGAASFWQTCSMQERQELVVLAKRNSKPLSLGTVMVIAFVLDLVSRPLIAFIVASGLLLKYSLGTPAKAFEKEKCLV